MESFKRNIIQSRLVDCGPGSGRKSLSAAQLRAALVEGSSPVCSSGKGGGGGGAGCHPIRAQRRGEVTRGGGQSSAPGL